MKTITVPSSELGDDWLPSAHMVRALTAIENVQEGDRVRVRQHRKDANGNSKWHVVRVQAVDKQGAQVLVQVDKWPVVYVSSKGELVELVEIQRTVSFRCVVCQRAKDPAVTKRAVHLADFVAEELVKSGGLQVVILRHTDPDDITGYCAEHGAEFLA